MRVVVVKTVVVDGSGVVATIHVAGIVETLLRVLVLVAVDVRGTTVVDGDGVTVLVF